MKSVVLKPKSRVLLSDLRQLIAEPRQDVARQVNSSLVLLYWRVGQRIHRDFLKLKRAEYGKRIVAAVGRQLSEERCRSLLLGKDRSRCAICIKNDSSLDS